MLRFPGSVAGNAGIDHLPAGLPGQQAGVVLARLGAGAVSYAIAKSQYSSARRQWLECRIAAAGEQPNITTASTAPILLRAFKQSILVLASSAEANRFVIQLDAALLVECTERLFEYFFTDAEYRANSLWRALV